MNVRIVIENDSITLHLDSLWDEERSVACFALPPIGDSIEISLEPQEDGHAQRAELTISPALLELIQKQQLFINAEVDKPCNCEGYKSPVQWELFKFDFKRLLPEV